MAEPLPDSSWPVSTFAGSNIEIIAGSADHSQINRLIGTPGSTPREETGAMRYVLTSCVALAAMTAAALADPSAPTRLSESQLDTITAGLNIDTPTLGIQTGCSSCFFYTDRNTLIPGIATQGIVQANDANSNGWTARYTGPLGMLAGGAGSGSGQSFGAGIVWEGDRAVADASGFAFGGGTGGALAYRGPLGLFQLGVGASVGKDAYSGAAAGAGKPLSLNDVGGTLNLPIGGGKNASFSLRVGIGAPGL